MAEKQELLVVSGRGQRLRLTGVGGLVVGAVSACLLMAIWQWNQASQEQSRYETRVAEIKSDHEKRFGDLSKSLIDARSEAQTTIRQQETRIKQMAAELEHAQLVASAHPCNSEHPAIRLLLSQQDVLTMLVQQSKSLQAVKGSARQLADLQGETSRRLREVNTVLDAHARAKDGQSPACQLAPAGQDPGAVLAYLGSASLHKSGWRFAGGKK